MSKKAIELIDELQKNNEDVLRCINKLKQTQEEEMYLNMQYYMEYCLKYGYITPQEWIKNYKHF